MNEEERKEEQRKKYLEVDRNRLAAERTMLAWIRTGLAAVGGGLAITRLISYTSFTHQVTAYIVGEFLILWGLGLFIYALREFQNICQSYKSEYNYSFNPLKIRVIVISVMIISLIILFLAST